MMLGVLHCTYIFNLFKFLHWLFRPRPLVTNETSGKINQVNLNTFREVADHFVQCI